MAAPEQDTEPVPRFYLAPVRPASPHDRWPGSIAPTAASNASPRGRQAGDAAACPPDGTRPGQPGAWRRPDCLQPGGQIAHHLALSDCSATGHTPSPILAPSGRRASGRPNSPASSSHPQTRDSATPSSSAVRATVTSSGSMGTGQGARTGGRGGGGNGNGSRRRVETLMALPRLVQNGRHSSERLAGTIASRCPLVNGSRVAMDRRVALRDSRRKKYPNLPDRTSPREEPCPRLG